MNSIPFHQLSSIPELVQDVLAGKSRIDFGFPTAVTPEFWTQRSREETDHPRDRQILVTRLHKQLDRFQPPEAILKNIDALREPETLTVVTGQQVALAGGPLLTLYKALTTIALARKLEKESGVHTVPVFWMATSDHNFGEAAQHHLIDQKNELVRLAWDHTDNRVPVGSLPLGEMSTVLIDHLEKDLPDSEFKPELLRILGEAYTPEATFANAFQKLGTDLLGPYGLVLLNPEDAALKQSCRDFWIRSIEDIDDRLHQLQQRGRELEEAGYRVQAPVTRGRPALFLLENGIRRKVVLEGRSRLAKSDIIIAREELLQVAKDEPERLSAGVTMRPMYQGYLLPAGAYVAGPNEMAYWGQLPGLFEPLGARSPAVVHRASFTLIEKKIRRKIEKLGATPPDFLGDLSDLTEEFVKRRSSVDLDHTFVTLKERCNKLEEHFASLLEMPPFGGLETAIQGAEKRIQQQLDTLENKFNQRLRQYHQDLVDSVERVTVHLRPAGKLQERLLSGHYYFARYGFSLIDRLIEVSLEKPGYHQMLDMEELLS